MRKVTQRELRNDSGRIMRGLDKGKTFLVTRNGVPVGELIPLGSECSCRSIQSSLLFPGRHGYLVAVSARTSTRWSIRIQRHVAEHRHARGLIDTSVVIDLDQLRLQTCRRKLPSRRSRWPNSQLALTRPLTCGTGTTPGPPAARRSYIRSSSPGQCRCSRYGVSMRPWESQAARPVAGEPWIY